MVMAVNLSGCTMGEKKETEQAKDTKEYRIGICQLMDHASLNKATEGFCDALTEKLGDRVEFDLRLAEEDSAGVIEDFVLDDMDLIMANATDSLKAAADTTSRIPIVGTSITDYGTALNIWDWEGVSKRNVTGTSDLAPLEQQAEMITELVKDAKIVGILYCSEEVNSVFQAQKMKQALEKDGRKCKEYTVLEKEEVERVAAEAARNCDAVYIPADNTMASSTGILKKIFLDAKVPVIAADEGICEAGIATLTVDYYDIGYMAGEMAYEILVKGKKPGKMEIQYSSKVTKKYNKENCEVLGIKIPEGYEEI